LMVTLMVFSAACYVRAERYDAAARKYITDQETVYKNLLPQKEIPRLILSRLESEWQRIAGTSGVSAEVPARPDALETLRRVVTGIPEALEARVFDLRISPSDVRIGGQARSHGDAQAIANALQQAGFDVEPPRTEAAGSEGVGFTLIAQPLEASWEAGQ